MRLFCAASLAAAIFGCFPAVAQTPMIDCIAKFHTSTVMNGEPAPGSLAAWKDRPCKTAVYTSGIGARAPGRLTGIRFVERPQHAKASVKSGASFVILPDKGFTGQDTMVVRLMFGKDKSALIRFAITVS